MLNRSGSSSFRSAYPPYALAMAFVPDGPTIHRVQYGPNQTTVASKPSYLLREARRTRPAIPGISASASSRSICWPDAAAPIIGTISSHPGTAGRLPEQPDSHSVQAAAERSSRKKQLKHHGLPRDVRLKHPMARMLREHGDSGKAVRVLFLSAASRV